MQELIVDFITSLDGYASAEGWPGWWGLESPEYLAWLDESAERNYTVLMGANTYRMMSGFAVQPHPFDENNADVDGSLAELTNASKVVFSSSLDSPLSWSNSHLVSGDAVEEVRAMKRDGTSAMRTVGSISLCRSFLEAGLVDRFRVVVFPVITGKTGRERIYDNYPDVALKILTSRTFQGGIQLLEFAPTVLDGAAFRIAN
jgi:dihydrofolate reductase